MLLNISRQQQKGQQDNSGPILSATDRRSYNGDHSALQRSGQSPSVGASCVADVGTCCPGLSGWVLLSIYGVWKGGRILSSQRAWCMLHSRTPMLLLLLLLRTLRSSSSRTTSTPTLPVPLSSPTAHTQRARSRQPIHAAFPRGPSLPARKRHRLTPTATQSSGAKQRSQGSILIPPYAFPVLLGGAAACCCPHRNRQCARRSNSSRLAAGGTNHPPAITASTLAVGSPLAVCGILAHVIWSSVHKYTLMHLPSRSLLVHELTDTSHKSTITISPSGI